MAQEIDGKYRQVSARPSANSYQNGVWSRNGAGYVGALAVPECCGRGL